MNAPASLVRAWLAILVVCGLAAGGCTKSTPSESMAPGQNIEYVGSYPRLLIPAIDLKASFGARHIGVQRGLPCNDEGNYVLAGWRTKLTGVFQDINKVRRGDRITLQLSPSVDCVYVVNRDAFTNDSSDVRVLANTPGTSLLTLLSDAPGRHKRVVVIAQRAKSDRFERSEVGATTTAGSVRPLPKVDVDGDGERDKISLQLVFSDPDKNEKVWVLRVTGGEASDAVALRTDNPGEARVFLGATELDSVPGGEIVLRQSSGAHAQQFVVFTWRDGALVQEPSPVRDGRSGLGGRWLVDAAYNSAVGVSCHAVGDERYVTLTDAEPNDPQDELLVGTSTEWLSKDDHWIRATSTAISFTRGSPEEFAAEGWHCDGLDPY